MIRRLLQVLRSRGEMSDEPGDTFETFRTAHAALSPDATFLPPPGRCDCQGCVDVTFALIMARYDWPDWGHR